MKKIYSLLFALLIVCSCQKEETTTLQISMQGFSSSNKTYIYENDLNTVACWAPLGTVDERIRINDHTYTVTVPENSGTSNAFSSIDNVVTSSEYYAFYPVELMDLSPASASFDILLPRNESYSSIQYSNTTRQLINAPMAGKAHNDRLVLEPLMGLLSFEMSGDGWLEYIEVRSSSKALSGPASVSINNDSCALITNGVADDCVKRLVDIHTQLTQTPQSFYVNIPAFSGQQCTITLGIRSSENGITYSYRKTTGANTRINRGSVISIPVQCNAGVPVDGSGFSLYSDGSEYQPYIITSSNTNLLSSQANNSKYFVLGSDITLSATINSFNGNLDGNGHTINLSHPMINTLTGTIRNLFTAGSINSSEVRIGSIANNLLNGGGILYCTNNASITSTNSSAYLGGMCGYAQTAASIQHCTNNGTLTNTGTHTGGIVAYCTCPISNCTNNDSIITNMTSTSTQRYIGGIVGQTISHIFDCNNTGIINDTRPSATNNDFLGGIVGQMSASSSTMIINCSNTGNMSTNCIKTCIGGIASDIKNCNILNCYSICNITANYCGGIAELTESSSTISNCYFWGTLTSAGVTIAGISRRNEGLITNCFSPSQYDFSKTGTSVSCQKLSEPTTTVGGDNLVSLLNNYSSNITGAHAWTTRNGYVVFE